MASSCLQGYYEKPLAYLFRKRSGKIQSKLTTAFVANEMYGLILENPHYEPKQIIKQIVRIYQYTISYAKAMEGETEGV
ncbi:hypothetical protein U9M48_004069 [Paspalum notatum var. saurae]|uniref:Uncharacterized protein n=1 Tax=Paspalum notatum var. saurae TaxID=547442 RepID=A0AAQ3PSG4_PASNO